MHLMVDQNVTFETNNHWLMNLTLGASLTFPGLFKACLSFFLFPRIENFLKEQR
jgi:hypothetical protein